MSLNFTDTPEVFGIVHIGFLLAISLFNIVLNNHVKRLDENRLLKILHHSGSVMMISEIFKQVFCYYYVYDRTINLWLFPWQMCSVAMYLAFIAIYLNKDKQNTVLIYLCTFNLFGGILALIFSSDMLRIQIPLTIHSFVYHGMIISWAIIAVHILKNRKDLNFNKTVILFLFTALIAEIINILAHYLINDIKREPNMFYINPFMATVQPVFSDIANNYGIGIEIIIYLSSLIFSAYIIFRLEKKYIFT